MRNGSKDPATLVNGAREILDYLTALRVRIEAAREIGDGCCSVDASHRDNHALDIHSHPAALRHLTQSLDIASSLGLTDTCKTVICASDHNHHYVCSKRHFCAFLQQLSAIIKAF